MTNAFLSNYKLRAIDDLFENIFSDLEDHADFFTKYEALKKQFLQLPIQKRIIFKGFCLLIEELAEYLMFPEILKKMKISFIIYWQKSINRTNIDDIILESNHTRIVPRFSSTKKADFKSPNLDSLKYNFTIHNHLSFLKNEYIEEYNMMVKNKNDLNSKIQKANILLSQRTEIIKLIVQYKIKNYNKKNINQSERRNLRIISDLMYLIDTMNRDLMKKSINYNKK